MSKPQKNIYAISPEDDYLRTLASFIYEKAAGNLLKLAEVKIILPNRRSVLKIKEDFVDISPNKAVILPDIISLGDIDEESLELSHALGQVEIAAIPPVISPQKRLLMLAKLIREKSQANLGMEKITFEASLKLAQSLGTLLDDISRNELGISALEKILPEELAQHRQISLDFIRFIYTEYPKLLEQQGVIDHTSRTTRIIDIYTKYLIETGSAEHIYIAGSTGSIPATRRLITAVSNLENGYVILPYIDTNLNSFDWDKLSDEGNETNHQLLVKRLLDSLEVNRTEIKYIADSPMKRAGVVSELMKPFSTIESWRSLKNVDMGWISLLGARNTTHESKLISAIIRHKLDENKSVAVITNNRELAEKTRLFLKRFGIHIDDSSGLTLDKTDEGKLFLSAAEFISSGGRISNLLPLLKAVGYKIDGFEKGFIRKNNIKYLKEIFEKFSDAQIDVSLKTLLQKVYVHLMKFTAQENLLGAMLVSTVEIINDINPDIKTDNENWQAVEELLGNLSTISGELVETNLFADSVRILLGGKKIWPKYIINKELAILSHMEARLQHYDCVIMADLVLGSWPAGKFSPWVNRAMFRQMEMPYEEETISLSAHDFAFHLHKSEIFITLSQYNQGEPMIESPFVTKLKTFCEAVECKKYNIENIYQNYVAELDGDFVERKRMELPRPLVPAKALINRLSVTKIEKLLKNPYEIYASEILRLRKLDELEKEPDQREYGTFCHKVLEEFTEHHQLDESKINLIVFNEIAEKVYKDFDRRNVVNPAWLPQLKELANWYIDAEKAYVNTLQRIFTEANAKLEIEQGGKIFTLICKADRVELTKESQINIADYKTGAFPGPKQIENLIASQLPLTGFMVKSSAFPAVEFKSEYELGKMIYYNFSFKDKGPEKKVQKIDLDEITNEIEVELKKLITDLQNPEVPYLIRPNPRLQPVFDDYEHLERRE